VRETCFAFFLPVLSWQKQEDRDRAIDVFLHSIAEFDSVIIDLIKTNYFNILELVINRGQAANLKKSRKFISDLRIGQSFTRKLSHTEQNMKIIHEFGGGANLSGDLTNIIRSQTASLKPIKVMRY
jgi:hypothetical protein